MSDARVCSVPLVPVEDPMYFDRSEESEFCNRENFLNSVAYVNQEFDLLGLTCLKYDDANCAPDTVFFINRLHDLLRLYHKTVTVKEDLEARNHRLMCEADHHQVTAARVKRSQEQLDRDLVQEREKARQLSLKYKQVCVKLKSEKEEVRRLTTVLQSRDLQHRHEQKKREREIHRLKERLHQLLADKVPDRKVGMDLMSTISRRPEEGRRATWKTGQGKHEEEMYQLLISNYEERHRELIQENGDLRDCLLSLQRELTALLKYTGDLSVTSSVDKSGHHDLSVSSDNSEDDMKSCLAFIDLDEGYFQMPYDIVGNDIERTFKETCRQICLSVRKSLMKESLQVDIYMRVSGNSRSSMSKSFGLDSSKMDSTERRHSSDTSEVERLRKQIISYKAVIQQQEDLIQQSLNSHPRSKENSFLHESQWLREKENLSEQKKLFFEERTNFERERKTITEAAVQLARERQFLQEERARLIKQHLQNISQISTAQHKKPRGEGHTSRLLPATPVFSPAKSGGKVLASDLLSGDLIYKALRVSLATDQVLDSDSQGSTGGRSEEVSPSHNPAVKTKATPAAVLPQDLASVCSRPEDVLGSAEGVKALPVENRSSLQVVDKFTFKTVDSGQNQQ